MEGKGGREGMGRDGKGRRHFGHQPKSLADKFVIVSESRGGLLQS